jgi:hypothetical protein
MGAVTPSPSYTRICTIDNSLIQYLLSTFERGNIMRSKTVKTGTFKCQCGCGQTFIGTYTTRAPMYADKKHRNRVLAARKAAKREEISKELWKVRKARQKVISEILRTNIVTWPDGKRLTRAESKAIAENYLPTEKSVKP